MSKYVIVKNSPFTNRTDYSSRNFILSPSEDFPPVIGPHVQNILLIKEYPRQDAILITSGELSQPITMPCPDYGPSPCKYTVL